jgi:drug/metabolite transporter (DMT)-like permease
MNKPDKDEIDISVLSDEQVRRCFIAAKEGRKYEIDKFWQRSLFFWGFIGAAFIAYAKAAGDHQPTETLFIACFGLICSVAWTLSNRGSKYWQEAWETKVERFEIRHLGIALFSHQEKRQMKGLWGAHLYSVSKLTILLSDFTALVWLIFALKASGLLTAHTFCPIQWPAVTFLGAVAYVVLLLVRGRKS